MIFRPNVTAQSDDGLPRAVHLPDEDVRRQALNDRAICFLIKPFDEDILIDCLDSAVQRYRDS
jgi:AmiR/NasT family two-component response regulator